MKAMKTNWIKILLFFALFIPVSVAAPSNLGDYDVIDYQIKMEKQRIEQIRLLIEIKIKEIQIKSI